MLHIFSAQKIKVKSSAKNTDRLKEKAQLKTRINLTACIVLHNYVSKEDWKWSKL